MDRIAAYSPNTDMKGRCPLHPVFNKKAGLYPAIHMQEAGMTWFVIQLFAFLHKPHEEVLSGNADYTKHCSDFQTTPPEKDV